MHSRTYPYIYLLHFTVHIYVYIQADKQADRASLVSGTPTPPPPPTGRVEQRGIRHQHVTRLVAHLVKISTEKANR